jgi:hypothetical protein
MVYPTQRYAIPTNRLLDGRPTLASLDVVNARRRRKDRAGLNLAQADKRTLAAIHAHYGGAGLARLITLAENSEHDEFLWFFQVICNELTVLATTQGHAPRAITYDNVCFPQGPALSRLNHMVVQPGLSNLLYTPGRQHGFLVYGLGGPRILVSHPFKGSTTEIYDVYRNSLDVVTSLLLRGYTGTFLFLDNLAGLNFTLAGFEAWALWFSIIATHSDLVLIVAEGEADLRDSQKLELSLTPDRIHKTLVRFRAGELTWAKEADVAGATFVYGGSDGLLSREEYLRIEVKLADSFVRQYVDDAVPRDQLIVLDQESGQVDRYPLDYADYRLSSPDRRR